MRVYVWGIIIAYMGGVVVRLKEKKRLGAATAAVRA